MIEADLNEWREINSGIKPPTWFSIVGDPAYADYLSPVGKHVAAQMTTGMRSFVGDDWVAKAMGFPDRRSVPIPALARFAPPLSLYDPRGAFGELLRWWASIELAKSANVTGLGRLRSDLRSDMKDGRLTYSLAQLRLGALGLVSGYDVQLELRVGTSPVDVVISDGNERLVIEVVTLFVEDDFNTQTAATDRHMAFLYTVGRTHGVYWSGDVPGRLATDERLAWEVAVSAIAEQAGRTQRSYSIATPGSGTLTVKPGHPPAGTDLVGPVLEADQGSRAVSRIRSKAERVLATQGAWIWVENHGVFHPLTQFEQLPLAHKAAAFGSLVSPIFSEYPGLGGIALSNGARRALPLPADQTVIRQRASAFRRSLPPDRVRDSILIGSGSEQPTVLNQVCADEGEFLDRALPMLGLAAGFHDLLEHRGVGSTDR